MRKTLIKEKGWIEEDLPCERSISNILNRLGYCLRRVQKANPIKKIPNYPQCSAKLEKRAYNLSKQ